MALLPAFDCFYQCDGDGDGRHCAPPLLPSATHPPPGPAAAATAISASAVAWSAFARELEVELDTAVHVRLG